MRIAQCVSRWPTHIDERSVFVAALPGRSGQSRESPLASVNCDAWAVADSAVSRQSSVVSRQSSVVSRQSSAVNRQPPAVSRQSG